MADDDEIVAIVVSPENARLIRKLVTTALDASVDVLHAIPNVDAKLEIVEAREQLYDINDALDLALLWHETDEGT